MRCGCHRTGCPCRDSRCHRGWLGADTDADQKPIPCLTCRDHLRHPHRPAEPALSDRARAAIQKAEHDD